MKILGIDPGLDRTGWAVLEKTGTASPGLLAAGLIHTSARLPLEKRLAQIFDSLAALITEHRPAEAAIEEVFFSKKASTQADTVVVGATSCLIQINGGLKAAYPTAKAVHYSVFLDNFGERQE